MRLGHEPLMGLTLEEDEERLMRIAIRESAAESTRGPERFGLALNLGQAARERLPPRLQLGDLLCGGGNVQRRVQENWRKKKGRRQSLCRGEGWYMEYMFCLLSESGVEEVMA